MFSKENRITPKMARVGCGLTMEDVAAQMGIHPQTYSKLEANPLRMTIKEAQQFSEIVGIPIDDIFFGQYSN